MSQDNIEPTLESLFVLTVQTKAVQSVTGTPLGDRMIVDVQGGTFEGPRLRGRVPASGGDWLIRTPRGSRLDVRLLLETVDGATILLQYSGRASQVDGKPRIEVAGNFDAPEGPYAWLNDVQAFGLGLPIPSGVRYHFFRFG
jgi:Protein of unknown function (DUF3237)